MSPLRNFLARAAIALCGAMFAAGCDDSAPGGTMVPPPPAPDASPPPPPPSDRDAGDSGTDAAPSVDSDGDGVSDATDCAPSDPARWQNIPYGYRDADGDGHTVATAGTLCAGVVLPPGYPSAPNGNDCNDADPSVFDARTLFADTDGDGVGAGAALSMCV